MWYKILDCDEPAVDEAKVLLNRILSRKFYQDVVTIDVLKNSQLRGMTDAQILADLLEFLPKISVELSQEEERQDRVRADEVVVLRRKVDTGMGEKDPVRKVK